MVRKHTATTNECTWLAGDSNDHGDAPVRGQAYWPMRHAQRFSWNWTPLLVKYLLCICISPATASGIDNQATTNRNTSITCHFWWPWKWASATPSTSSDVAHPGLQLKPLEATIRQVFAPISVIGHHNCGRNCDFTKLTAEFVGPFTTRLQITIAVLLEISWLE